MILIVTHTGDYTVDYVAVILNRLQKPFLRLNTDLLPSTPFEIRFDTDSSISIKDHSSFKGLWFRRVKLPVINQYSDPVNKFVALDYDSLLFNLVTSLDANNVVSNPYRIYEAENKVYQLKTAKAIGFHLPPTLITHSIDQLKAFCERHATVIKPIRTGKIELENESRLIYTTFLADRDWLDKCELTPCIAQKKIEKVFELRVTMVGHTVFAAKVESQNDPETVIDWRRKQLKFEPFELPVELQKQCVQLVERLGLHFGAIDLIYSTDGNYYFLEINPNGQWVWIELDTGLKISEALINYLYGE